jgi:hypothetical protein
MVDAAVRSVNVDQGISVAGRGSHEADRVQRTQL